MTVYYLDTSIWLDLYEERGWNGRYALALITVAIAENQKILFSDLNALELKRLGYGGELPSITRAAGSSLRRCHTGSGQLREMLDLARSGLPRHDVLHAIIARDAGAVLVSRDRHFRRLSHISAASLPEDII